MDAGTIASASVLAAGIVLGGVLAMYSAGSRQAACRHCGAALRLRIRRALDGAIVRCCAVCGGYHGETV